MARIRILSLAILALFAVLVLPVAGAGGAPAIDEYRLPNSTTAIDAMCIDSNGNVWLAQSSPAFLYRFDPRAGTFQKHEIDASGDIMVKGMSAEGSEYIWMADQAGQRVIGYDVAKDKFYKFDIQLKLDPTNVVSDGTYLWVSGNMELGRVPIEGADTIMMHDYYVDSYKANLADMATDRAGNIWFVEYTSGKLGGYYRMDDQVRVYPIPSADSGPTCLDIDSLGRLWFIESGANKLGMFDTSMASFREYDMPSLDGKQVYPKRLAVDGDGNVWLTDTPSGRAVKFYPQKGAFVPISLNGSKPYPTFIRADGNTIWLVESGTGNLARLRADSFYGLSPTPAPTAPTVAPSPSVVPSATPRPSSGSVIVTLVALAAVLLASRRRL
jgi:streptogramin lyase